MTDKLLNCPFCGGEAMLDTRRVEDSTFYGVMCFTPGCCALNTIYPTEEMAIQAWNTRKPMDRIVEQLEDASCYIEDGDGHAGHLIFTDEAIEIVKEGGKDE